MKKNIDEVVKDGFNLDQKGNFEIDLALISLRIALKAYFSTFQKFRSNLRIFETSATSGQKKIDAEEYSIAYCEACAECIVHFQHFAELVCKNFLRNDHPLLSDTALLKPEILHKLLHEKPLTSEEELTIKSIEFTEALERIIKLVETKNLKDWVSLSFIVENKSALTKLNALRNRVWHRGIFILRYTALDEFVGGHIFPFVSAVVAHPAYSAYKHLWRYKELSCGIDPIGAIASEMKTSDHNYNVGKIAFLKEIGRAAFENPLIKLGKESGASKSIEKVFNNVPEKRAKAIALMESAQDHFKINNCPVCGTRSLVIYEITEHSDECEQEQWQRTYTNKIKCECCSFELDEGKGIKNASAYGFNEIDDYWTTETT